MWFRWILYAVLAAWAARLLRLGQAPAPRGPLSDFHPGDGGPNPSSPAHRMEDGKFSSGEIVDGEFEDVPGSRRP
jgi:hypothetical protein